MSELDHFQICGDHAEFRPTGEISLAKAVQLATTAILHARTLGIRNLLADGTKLTGFEPPSLAERYAMFEEWSIASCGTVRVAFLLKPEMIDVQKFGVRVGQNRGMVCDVFASEKSALAWLDRSKTT